jgi:hypothetical protein
MSGYANIIEASKSIVRSSSASGQLIAASRYYLEISGKKEDVSEVKSNSGNEGGLVSDSDYNVSSTVHTNEEISGKLRLARFITRVV